MSLCPTCRKAIAPPPENPHHPFCSARCKLLDLGRWLSGDYRVPGPAAKAAGEEDGEG